MATHADKLVSEIRALPEEEKLRLLDAILTDLDKPIRNSITFGRLKPESAGSPTERGGFRQFRTKN